MLRDNEPKPFRQRIVPAICRLCNELGSILQGSPHQRRLTVLRSYYTVCQRTVEYGGVVFTFVRGANTLYTTNFIYIPVFIKDCFIRI